MSKPVLFNYDLLEDTASRKVARDGAKAIHGILRASGAGVVEVGKRLNEVRAALGAATFSSWLECEFRWKQPIASNYMRAATVFGGADCLDKFQPWAIYTLSRRNVPEEAIAEALRIARNGEAVTGVVAKQILSRHHVRPIRNDAGVARTPKAAGAERDGAAVVDLGNFDSLRQMLSGFAEKLDAVVTDVAPETRIALADQFLEIAFRLRSAATSAARSEEATSPKRRKALATA